MRCIINKYLSIHITLLSLGCLLSCRRYMLIKAIGIFHTYSVTFSKSFTYQKSKALKTVVKKRSMSTSNEEHFHEILGTSILAADHAGKMVRSIMKGGDLRIVEKTGADDLQVLGFSIIGKDVKNFPNPEPHDINI